MKAKELNGYYYCFSFDEWSHDLYSITEMSRKEAILTAIDNGVRLYLVNTTLQLFHKKISYRTF